MKKWTDDEIKDIMQKAIGMFGTLCGITSTPREAVEIISMMHLMLYMNYGTGDLDVDTMLEQYCVCFKKNFSEQAEMHKAQAN